MDDILYFRFIIDKFVFVFSRFKWEIKVEWLEVLFLNDVINNIRFKVSFFLG